MKIFERNLILHPHACLSFTLQLDKYLSKYTNHLVNSFTTFPCSLKHTHRKKKMPKKGWGGWRWVFPFFEAKSISLVSGLWRCFEVLPFLLLLFCVCLCTMKKASRRRFQFLDKSNFNYEKVFKDGWKWIKNYINSSSEFSL